MAILIHYVQECSFRSVHVPFTFQKGYEDAES